MELDKFVDFKKRVVENISKVIVGKEKEIEIILVAFLSGGHVLLEDIPGTGKTMLVKAFSKTLDLPFKRIQFTPDLLPSDITGINFYNQKTEDFQFRQGPLFSNIVLTDEINRATPRTQAALLEAMEEKQITADGTTRKLDMPFMVLATQNPIESFGTFPLPEAQMDRFLIRMKMGYPSKEEEKIIINKNISDPLEKIKSVIKLDELAYILSNVSKVTIQDDVMDYLVEIVSETRNRNNISLGASPRGSIALFKASQAYAAMNARDYILPEDIKLIGPFVLNHRIISPSANSIEDATSLIHELIASIEVPLENKGI